MCGEMHISDWHYNFRDPPSLVERIICGEAALEPLLHYYNVTAAGCKTSGRAGWQRPKNSQSEISR